MLGFPLKHLVFGQYLHPAYIVAYLGASLSSDENNIFLTSKFSTMASITRSADFTAATASVCKLKCDITSAMYVC